MSVARTPLVRISLKWRFGGLPTKVADKWDEQVLQIGETVPMKKTAHHLIAEVPLSSKRELASTEKNVLRPANGCRVMVPVTVILVALCRLNDMLFFRHRPLAISPI